MNEAIFHAVRCVAVPVTDQDRSTEHFTRFGFTVSLDTELQPGFRWIEMTPAAGATVIALVKAANGLPAGIDTGIRLTTADARAAHAAVARLGLEAGDLLDWATAPLMFSFLDPDGNRYYVSESG